MGCKWIGLRGAAILSAFLLISCSEYNRVSGLSEAELRTVSGSELCEAYAQSTQFGDKPKITNEVRRRGLACERELSYYRIDCSGLAVISAQTVASNAFIATVRNMTALPKKFLIESGGIASADFVLEAGATQSYMITASSVIASIGGALNPRSSGINVANCVTARYY